MSGETGGEIRDVGSDMVFLRIRVGELNASGSVRLVRVWVGVIVGGWALPFIILSVLFWLCTLWDVR